MRGRTVTTVGVLILVLTTAGCGGPTSKADVCTSFNELDEQLLEGNGIIGNPLFRKASTLADVAERYEGTESLSGDAEELSKIAESDSTNAAQLMNATRHIASLCGHPLGTNSMFGK